MKLSLALIYVVFLVLWACGANPQKEQLAEQKAKPDAINSESNLEGAKVLPSNLLGKKFQLIDEQCRLEETGDTEYQLTFYENKRFLYFIKVYGSTCGEAAYRYVGTYEVEEEGVILNLKESTFAYLNQNAFNDSLRKEYDCLEVESEKLTIAIPLDWKTCGQSDFVLAKSNPEEHKDILPPANWMLSVLNEIYSGVYIDTDTQEKLEILGFHDVPMAAEEYQNYINVVYTSPNQPEEKYLEVKSYQESDSTLVVIFKDDPQEKEYRLQTYPHLGKLTCQNPDGSAQTFYLKK